MFKKVLFPILALAILTVCLTNLSTPQPVHAGALIEGQVTLHDNGTMSIFVTSEVNIKVHMFDGTIVDKNINDVTLVNNLAEVSYFELLPLNGETIGLYNNTNGQWAETNNVWRRVFRLFMPLIIH